MSPNITQHSWVSSQFVSQRDRISQQLMKRKLPYWEEVEELRYFLYVLLPENKSHW